MNKFSGIIKTKFFLKMFPVGLDGFDAQIKLTGNMSGSHARSKQLQYFQFPFGEFGDFAVHLGLRLQSASPPLFCNGILFMLFE